MNLRCIKAPNTLIPFTDPRIRWPMFGSIKYDGHRMVSLRGVKFITPSGKDHVNRDIANHFSAFNRFCNEHNLVADGELWSPTRPFNELQSIVRTHDMTLPPDVGYYVFDLLTWDEWENRFQVRQYASRYGELSMRIDHPNVYAVGQYLLCDARAAEEHYEIRLAEGHEGIMLRSPLGTYKHGRCTHLESHLLKFKNYVTEDAIIVGVEQMEVLKPGVERTVGPTGLLERTFRQEDHELAEAVGSFLVRQGDTTFKVKPGKGHTMEDRKRWWAERATLIGTGVEFSHMPHGAKDVPRIGSLVRFRPELAEELPSHLLSRSL